MAVGSASAEALASLVLPLPPSSGDGTAASGIEEGEGPLELTSPLAWAVVTRWVQSGCVYSVWPVSFRLDRSNPIDRSVLMVYF